MHSNVQQFVPFKKVGNIISPKIDNDSLDIPTGRSATITVAANDSSTLSKQQADYVCNGTNDDIEIQAAITALPANGGKIILLEGILKPLTRIAINKANVTIEGNNTIITPQETGDNQEVFDIEADDITISNITFDGYYSYWRFARDVI